MTSSCARRVSSDVNRRVDWPTTSVGACTRPSTLPLSTQIGRGDRQPWSPRTDTTGTSAFDLGPAQTHRSRADRVDASDKRLINCEAVDVNQLMPLKYDWAWEHYLNGCANHWMPTEVPMGKDIELWKSDKL